MNDILNTFPIEKVRAQFPALNRTQNGYKVAYFDAGGGTQALQSVIDTSCQALVDGIGKKHAMSVTTKEAERKHREAREAFAALVNADPDEVSFGVNCTRLMFDVARALSRDWKEDDEIVVTELEHNANIDSWRLAAEDKGAKVRYIPVDTKTHQLDLSNLSTIINPKTKLVAVGIANNCIGTINDVKTITAEAKKYGAITAGDAGHSIAHFYTDMKDLGLDMIFTSAYKCYGPFVGVAVIKKEIHENLKIYRIAPSASKPPEMIEIGTQSYDGIPAVKCITEFIAGLGTGDTLVEKIKSGYKLIEEYENALADIMREGLSKIPEITLYQSEGPKAPTIAFRANNMTQEEFSIPMCEKYGVFINEGHFGSQLLCDIYDVSNKGWFCRASIAPYCTLEDVNRFLKGAQEIIASGK